MRTFREYLKYKEEINEQGIGTDIAGAGGAAWGGLVGGALGSLAGPIGTVAGAGLGATVGGGALSAAAHQIGKHVGGPADWWGKAKHMVMGTGAKQFKAAKQKVIDSLKKFQSVVNQIEGMQGGTNNTGGRVPGVLSAEIGREIAKFENEGLFTTIVQKQQAANKQGTIAPGGNPNFDQAVAQMNQIFSDKALDKNIINQAFQQMQQSGNPYDPQDEADKKSLAKRITKILRQSGTQPARGQPQPSARTPGT